MPRSWKLLRVGGPGFVAALPLPASLATLIEYLPNIALPSPTMPTDSGSSLSLKDSQAPGGDALVDTAAEDTQINELGSTSSHFEGQVEGRNLATPQKLKEKYSVDVLDDKKLHFQAILQLLQLLVTLIPDSNNQKFEARSGASQKSLNYVDALTNLMVRNGEVVAAVACGGRLENPTGGIISFNSPPIDEVRPQYIHPATGYTYRRADRFVP
jgi:hypothetical protein